MAVTSSVSIDESTDTINIESLQITDQEIVEFLSEYESDERDAVVSEALSIGVKAMQLMDTSQDVEYVERRLGELEDGLTEEVETFQEEIEETVGDDGTLPQTLEEYLGEEGTLEQRIEAAFEEDGPFVDRLDEELGKDGERIQAALDPDRDGTPTNRLETRLTEEIQDLREKIVEEETEEKLRQRTYLKGGDFEDTVQGILEDIVRQTPNNVAYTGETTGAAGRDVGDFVVSLADTGQDIVIEAKTENYSTQNIKEEMEEAIQNRDADYGVFVTDTLENLPRTKTGWFHEYSDQNTVVVAMSETEEADIDAGYLRIAFNWARMRAVEAYAEVDDGVDAEMVQSELSEIESEINRFQTIRAQCTEISKSRERIEETLRDIENDVKKRLTAIEAELVKGE